MRVCVTGGTGFVGGFLVRDLLAKGESVRVLARGSSRADQLRTAGAEVVAGDLGDAESIARAVAGAEVVYHLAAKVGAAARKDYFETHVAGTERVLAACATGGIKKFVYLSSLAVYGPVQEGERIDEDTPLDARPELRDPYAGSKIAADVVVRNFAARSGVTTVIVRPGVVFGPGRQPPVAIFGMHLGGSDIVFGGPQNRFPLNYVENLVEAIQCAAAASRAGLREFNVVDDDDLTLARYHKVKSATDGSRARYLPGWPLLLASPFAEVLRRIIPMGDTRLSRHQLRRALQDRWYDTRRIREQAGWKPRVALEEALQRTLKMRNS